MNPNQFKFIQEFPQYRDILNGSSFEEYKKSLAALKRKIPEQEYKYVSGFSFEFVIGGLLHFYGGMPEFGVIDYQPTYVGSVDNPDHGADGFGLAFAGAGFQNTRPAIVQIKFRSNQTDQIREYGRLPDVVRDLLMLHDTVNLTLITTSLERSKKIDITAENVDENTVAFAKFFRLALPQELRERVFIRVIDMKQLTAFDNFYFWKRLRKFSGLFE